MYNMLSQTCINPSGKQNNFHCQNHTHFNLLSSFLTFCVILKLKRTKIACKELHRCGHCNYPHSTRQSPHDDAFCHIMWLILRRKKTNVLNCTLSNSHCLGSHHWRLQCLRPYPLQMLNPRLQTFASMSNVKHWDIPERSAHGCATVFHSSPELVAKM